jgi:hypothetical protein
MASKPKTTSLVTWLRTGARKALAAQVAPVLLLAGSFLTGSDAGTSLSGPEIIAVLIAEFTALGVYGVRNKPEEG